CIGVLEVVLGVFFFSSRRRHTRFKCDWSSDVCSSDLFRPLHPTDIIKSVGKNSVKRRRVNLVSRTGPIGGLLRIVMLILPRCLRSEERRVGKESGSQSWG